MVLVIVKMAPSIINSAILLSDVSFVSMNLSNFELINRDLYDCSDDCFCSPAHNGHGYSFRQGG